MLFSQNASKIIFLLLLYYSFSRLLNIVGADPPYPLCSNHSRYADNSSFHHSLNNLFYSLSSNSSVSKFYNTYAGNNLDRVYGLYMCFGNTTIEVCNSCISTASQDILKHCPNRKEAIIWEEHCQLRYSNTNFFSTLDIIGNQAQRNSMNILEPERRRFKDALNITLSRAVKDAVYDPSPDMYAAKKVRYLKSETLYAQVQCTGDLLANDCNTCLQIAINNASSCCNSSLGARIYSKSCYLRYEVYDFDGGAFEEIQMTAKNSKWKIWVTMIFVVSAFLAVTLLGSFVYCLKMKIVSHRGKTKIRWEDIISQEVPLHNIADPNGSEFLYQNFKAGDEQKAMEFPYIDLASIHAATDNFSESNMLGQGGFGPVYKGKLSDGTEIAVKRLSSCSHQGSEEFTNEVLLIMKLQHKNLVRLLGFCVDGEEKLLVYEYMPNGSLDVSLFDSTKCAQLNWSRRLSIINGIAKGMLYLHEDSRLKIIHRDLKASNILLDSNMDPKISDFGMARIVEGSEGEASTCRLVGTYGYMAPEYAMEGLYSVKSDVFSFGVLLLEIITGKRNAGFHDQSKLSHSLLSYAWQLWNEGKAVELMDPSVAESCCPDEFIKCVYLGLMCVQEDACERPTMSAIMLMLEGGTESSTLRQPDRPAFSWGISNEYDQINIDSLSFDRLTGSSDIKANE